MSKKSINIKDKWSIEQFKEHIEKYFQPIGNYNRRICNRNNLFANDYINKLYIPRECKLIFGRIPGGIHFWWVINGDVYDTTVFQFTSNFTDSKY